MTLSVGVQAWVDATFGAPVADELFAARHLSRVTGVRLADGRELVVKARAGVERARACVAGQLAIHEDGFPCPRPLSGVDEVEGMAVHAEEYWAGGEELAGTDTSVVDAFAELLADLMTRLARLAVPRPAAEQLWLAWDHPGPRVWPEETIGHSPSEESNEVPAWLTDVAGRVRARMAAVKLPDVVGHGDWESQNIRWRDGRVLVVHDWDSLTTRPEAALVGAAAATFPTGAQPVLAPLAATEHFIDSYERSCGRDFSGEERQVAWAAGLWLAAHNARCEVILNWEPLVIAALERELEPRSLRAGI